MAENCHGGNAKKGKDNIPLQGGEPSETGKEGEVYGVYEKEASQKMIRCSSPDPERNGEDERLFLLKSQLYSLTSLIYVLTFSHVILSISAADTRP